MQRTSAPSNRDQFPAQQPLLRIRTFPPELERRRVDQD